ncbi:hypothetical protein M409DRAFT_57692 [Zasmidium cellare ATCC 36951]|uniref:N-acetyltransferase domain-containing protein n=1 Tax=Zasmidium cellare ATCC 36951 TaxID=1080233 RepID=A0A6A6CBH7_ZASCE|nr:uncharacterized protein M409DRAFT_57692 [Zasmidium cellare ATCC 36951]KAF2163009.1 hypothetical protein M409DRAFT_57692 [Zasmidium cellare ATCC 36951]
MATSNKIHLRLATNEDVDSIVHVMSRSFQHNAAFVDIFYPDHDTPSGHAQAIQTFQSYWQNYKSHADLVVATTTTKDSEEIIGFALWTYMSSSINLSPPTLAFSPFAKTEDDAEFAKQVWKSFVVPRRSAVLEAEKSHPGTGLWVLEYLAVDPGHQRKGAGRELVQWGLDKARKDATEAIVEGTPPGQPCYRACGFKTVIKEMEYVVEERFEGRRLPEIAFMRHPCR